MQPAALAPANTVVDRPRIVIVQRIEPAFAMLLNKEPDLLDGLPDLGRFRAAAPVDPLPKRSCRRTPRLAFLPRRDAQRRRQLARRRDKPEPLRRPVNLAIGTGGRRRFNEGGNHIPDSIAYFVRALGNGPPHEFRPSRAICRDCSLLEHLGERPRIAVLPAMIECTKAKVPIGGNVEHPHQLPCARLSASIFRKFGSGWNLARR
jgi:hypothetical protein